MYRTKGIYIAILISNSIITAWIDISGQAISEGLGAKLIIHFENYMDTTMQNEYLVEFPHLTCPKELLSLQLTISPPSIEI